MIRRLWPRQLRNIPHFAWVLIGMVFGGVLGMVVQSVYGAEHPGVSWFAKEVALPVGQLFMKLIFMVVIPLLFSALVLGVAELSAAKKIGRIGGKALSYTVVLSSVAVALALAGVNLTRPGDGFPKAEADSIVQKFAGKVESNVEKSKEGKSPAETILGFVPENPFEEAAKPKLGGVLPIMVFALMFGIALTAIEPERALPVVNFLEGIYSVSQKLIEYAMRLAPFGVFGFMFVAGSSFGATLFAALAKYGGLVLVVLAIQLFLTYSLFLKFIAQRSPMAFFHQVREVMATAFATSSSNATLPVALRVAQKEVGLPRSISGFVLTCGATANQNGTALFEGITVLFLAQVFGVQLDLMQQLTVVGLCIVAGIGTAGVPGGAWPMIAAICGMIGVPPAAIALCYGIDRLLDMSRTVVNVVGDITIAACVSKGETELIPEAAAG